MDEKIKIMKTKNRNIKVGNILEKGTFVSGSKYYVLDSAEFEGQTFKSGVKVAYQDPDDGAEYTGEVYRIILTEHGDIEVSFNAPIGRVDLEDLLIVNY